MKCEAWERDSEMIKGIVEKIDIEKVKKKVDEFMKWFDSKTDEELEMEENRNFFRVGSAIDDLVYWIELYNVSEDDFCRYENGRLVVRDYKQFIENGGNEMDITKEG